MPRHKLDGSWRFFAIGRVLGSVPVQRGEFDLRRVRPNDGDLDPGSNLDQVNVTGKITGRRLEFEHSDGAGFKKVFIGELFVDEPGQLAIAGVFSRRPVAFASRKKARAVAADDQTDGSWVIVRP